MTSGRLLRFEVPSRDALDRLATGPLPGELRAGQPRAEFCRDVYFDTVARDLERRGVTVRVRIWTGGSRTLAVDVRERELEDGQIVRTRAEAAIDTGVPLDALAGDTEPARLLQAMIDPTRLGAQLEVETMRRTRDLHVVGARNAEMELILDAVTVRHGEVVAEFEEMELTLPEAEVKGIDEIVRTLADEFGTRVTLSTKLARSRELLERLEIHSLEREVRGAREVAVVAHANGKIALRREGEGLRVPTGQGSGAEAARQVLRAALGHSQGHLRLLGTSAGFGTRPAVEVWIAERVPDEDGAKESEAVVWLPLTEALALVGSPVLREARTLTALHMAVRAAVPEGRTVGWTARAVSKKEHPFHLVPKLEGKRRTEEEPEAMEPTPSSSEGLPPDSLLNMELSELAFQERVLALAEDERTPLLERVRFLAILGSNLDQFFMTRVAGFHQQLASGSSKRTLDGLTPDEQLQAVGVRVRQLFDRTYRFLWDELLPKLQENDIHLLRWEELEESGQAYLTANYAVQLAAVLTPLAADPSHPFPHIRNLRPALAVVVRVPETDAEHFAAIELPGDLPRLVPLPGGRRFIPLEDVIRASLPTLYNGLEVVSAHVFRVTRSANFSIDEEDVNDLLEAVQEKVLRRPLGPVVRLEVQDSMPGEIRDMLLRELQFESSERIATLREEDVYAVDRLVDLFGLNEMASLPFEEHRYPPMDRSSPLSPDQSVWSAVRDEDVLVRFPYDSFEETVERALAEAADDPAVVSIKITLYRTSESSGVVKYLRKARRAGKDVAALVELKASFDEQRNIEWARALESVGIHVVYGPAHLKVHAKIMLIVRKEGDELCRYLYVGTGNLNASTAAGYTDLGMFTANAELGAELHDVFNGLTGYSVRTEYEHLLVAPFNMRDRFLELIEREIEHARSGRGGHMRVKINGLTDPGIIAKLYQASQAGVRVEMIVRGLCCLRPGVPGLSENISVISILGRFLEHSRIYRFGNAGAPAYFIGSADWRPRNLKRRVEVVAPVYDPRHQAVLDGILQENLDNADAWDLQPDGAYVQQTPDGERTSLAAFLAGGVEA
jgi:polyphosphate kinase